jgi:predicted phosphodiesterase
MAFKRFIVAADNHGGLIDEITKKKFFEFAKSWKAHYRIHLGDWIDAAPLRKNCSAEEKAGTIAEDYQMGLDFVQEFRPHLLCNGNHDDRLWMHMRHAADGILRERCTELALATEDEFRKIKIKWVPYHIDRYLQMPEGGPKLIHGFRATMYPAKSHFEHWGSVLHGHTHKPDFFAGRHIERGSAYSVACMADLNQMEYSNRQPSRLGHRNGWLYGIINTKTSAWHAWHVIREANVFISPQGIL